MRQIVQLIAVYVCVIVHLFCSTIVFKEWTLYQTNPHSNEKKVEEILHFASVEGGVADGFEKKIICIIESC